MTLFLILFLAKRVQNAPPVAWYEWSPYNPILPYLPFALPVLIGWIPGAVAAKRKHPQATPIMISGFICAILLLLWPIAFFWAWTNGPKHKTIRKLKIDR